MTAWDITTASYTGTSISTQGTEPSGFTWKPDGTRLWEVDEDSATLYEYSVSTAWDISTASYNGNSISLSDSDPVSWRWKPDGNGIWELGQNQEEIIDYYVYGTWDITDGVEPSGETKSLGGGGSSGMVWKPDGTKIYVTEYYDSELQEYTCDAWDISTATLNTTIAPQASDPQGMAWKPDGTKMWVIGYSNTQKIFEYDVSTAWDLSTASYTNTSFGVKDYYPTEMEWGPDGYKLWTAGRSGENIYEYSLVDAPSTPQNITSTVSNDDITLNWDAVNWNGDEGHYDIKRAQSSGGAYTEITTVASGTTTYTDSALLDGERYYYVVEADNSEGGSGNSNETAETTALPAPSGVSANEV